MDMGDYQTPERMAVKLTSTPLPNVFGRSVLDVGCDHGAYMIEALKRGAKRVEGIDRGRNVRGQGFVDLSRIAVAGCPIHKMDLGKQWHDFGAFDVVLCLNMYHHAYRNCLDHRALWFWLWGHTRETLLWESPLGTNDPVSRDCGPGYNQQAILSAVKEFFEIEDQRRGWISTRWTLRLRPRDMSVIFPCGNVKKGVGGAAKAFLWNNGARIKELKEILGREMIPGSLNLDLSADFDWNRNYFRAQMLDWRDTRRGFGGPQTKEWVRLYPGNWHGKKCYAIRFEHEVGFPRHMELISDQRLNT